MRLTATFMDPSQTISAGTISTSGGSLSARQWLDMFQVTEADLGYVRSYGARVYPRVGDYITEIYAWMRQLPVYARYFSDPDTVTRAQTKQMAAWGEFFKGKVDDAYLEGRREIGRVHAQISLPPQAYMAAMSVSYTIWTERLYDGSLSADEHVSACRALAKLMNLETTVVMETFVERSNQVIINQGRALLEMSTPVAALWDGILMLPIVGIVDSKRAQDIMNRMLERVAETQSRAFILDISGVAVVDTAVANHLIKMTKATRLMGCDCVISGISPSVAQTMVELGIEVGEIRTTSTLKDALKAAFAITGSANATASATANAA